MNRSGRHARGARRTREAGTGHAPDEMKDKAEKALLAAKVALFVWEAVREIIGALGGGPGRIR